ncbi:(R,R)-butanediol dehydrogenase/meso-butanediol dehydrogenase/diacetyl reductase [Pseudarthrobacter sp. W1I19]|uniref:zinc-dependent alcohol dehydrogenase n=1 Tax=Pseudarthrobacter sp. W1I19 TaxID=3042288 RepID=UPI002780F8B4|nr:alcohol dehydrogenase catalytic domain-containing protein [Pseudarthrobacter sp. W1I19]MDQ0923877.1 (R,R)-butanediol dehydrogenase/meso-butanediol dehydrogenase/diacetyl reductase [Pseudarthrobacter sp. W1I19]
MNLQPAPTQGAGDVKEAAAMKAAVLTGPDTIAHRDVPLPALPEGYALVRVELTGLCGTDFSILRGTHPRARTPLIMGHEITGIVEVPASTGPRAGSRVTVEPLISCGTCLSCTQGNTHVCKNLQLYGIDVPGSLAEFVALPANALIPVKKTVPVSQVALAEPLAVAVHAVKRSGLSGGESVLIYGAGPIGILTALVARQEGAAKVLIAEPSADRLRLAAQLGFDTVPDGASPAQTIRLMTGGNGADIVFDSAAHPSVAAEIAGTVRVMGTIVLVGVYKSPAKVDLQALTFAENTVLGVRVYTRADIERAVELIESNALGLGRLPVDIFPLEQAELAFENAMAAGAAVKTMVGPPSSEPFPRPAQEDSL